MSSFMMLFLLQACGIGVGFNLDIDGDNDGVSADKGDCDDHDSSIHPNQDEIRFDGVDQNCNGMNDEDLDGDGQSVDEGDCDDSASYVFNGAIEFKDEVDNDCDGTIDETNNLDEFVTWSNATQYASTLYSIVGGNFGQDISNILVGETEGTGGADRSGLVSFDGTTSILGGYENDRLGSALALGDFNGDSNLEVSVGALGSDAGGTASGVLAIFSSGSLGTQTSYDTGLAYLSGAEAFSYAGSALASGHINADGNTDLVVGAYGLNNSRGAVYLVCGKPDMNSGSLGDLADQIWLGENDDDRFGWALAGGEDVNGDGYDDVLIGAPQNSTSALQAGAVYLYVGGEAGPGTNSSAVFYGQNAYDQAGYSVALAQDINGDGYGDMIVGAPGSVGMSQDGGQVYVVYGGGSLSGDQNLSRSAVRISGATTNQQFGLSVASLGDINADGFDDVAMTGAVDDDLMGTGAVYLYLGGDFSNSLLTDNQADATFITTQASTALFVNGVGHVDGPVYENVGPYEDFAIVYGNTETNETLTHVLLGQATLN